MATLSPGARLGPYSILAPLGAGGMGQVYSALDTRLEREIALKVLHEEAASDASRVRRFETEARSASALNHPNIVTIHEIGSAGGVSYIAMERVAGKTLRKLLAAGAMPASQLPRLASQIAEGLASAHEAGIVHRDLKPENVMISRDGVAKILDFGVAKLTPGLADGEEPDRQRETATIPGTVLGTVGYMSPEQAAGGAVDFRSDQFAFGSMLYEMATGARAFQRRTSVETLAAILNEQPQAMEALNPRTPPPLRWIVERCLEKDPARRYASTRDLVRDLENVRDRSAGHASLAFPARRGRPIAWVAALAMALGLGLFAGNVLLRKAPSSPAFRRLTFRRGSVTAARFTPDGQSVVYSARWGDLPEQLFLARIGSPESIPLPLPSATRLLSISTAGNLALGLRAFPFASIPLRSTLGAAPLAGGQPREIREAVQSADYFPGSDRLAVAVGGRLESPPGTVLYKDGVVGRARVSPRGDRIAILEQDHGQVFVSVVETSGKRTRLAASPTISTVEGMSASHQGLAWSTDGEEVFYSGGTAGAANAIMAVSTRGKVRTVLRVPVFLAIQDVARDGRILLTTGEGRSEISFRPANGIAERDLAWFSMSGASQFSGDGTAVLLNEFGEAGRGETYLRKTDGSPAVRVAEETVTTLSHDAAWIARVDSGKALLLPTGAGESRTLSQPGFEYDAVSWFPDGHRLLVVGRRQGRRQSLFVQDASGGALTPLSTEGIQGESRISPDGNFVAAEQPDGFWIYPVDGRPRSRLAGVEAGETIASWSEDGQAVLTTVQGSTPFPVYRVDVHSGRRELWKTVAPSDPAGISNAQILLRPDGSSVMNVVRWNNSLFLVEGAR